MEVWGRRGMWEGNWLQNLKANRNQTNESSQVTSECFQRKSQPPDINQTNANTISMISLEPEKHSDKVVNATENQCQHNDKLIRYLDIMLSSYYAT